MGCLQSKGNELGHVDDSVHVMIAHDKKAAKAKGMTAPQGYVPRAEHPLLQPKQKPIITANEEEGEVVHGGNDGGIREQPTNNHNNHSSLLATTETTTTIPENKT